MSTQILALEHQLDWLESELATTLRKYDRWIRQKRISPQEASRHIVNLRSIRETIHAALQIKQIMEAETGDESEMELSDRGDRISDLMVKMCFGRDTLEESEKTEQT